MPESGTYFRPAGLPGIEALHASFIEHAYRPHSHPTRAKLQTVRRRAADHDVPVALYTNEMFSTGHDADNRAAVRAVPTEQLDLVGLALRAAHRDADAVLRGLKRHP